MLSKTLIVKKEGPLFCQQLLGGIFHNGPLKQQDRGQGKRKKNVPLPQNRETGKKKISVNI